MNAWQELVDLFDYKLGDLEAGRTPKGGRHSVAELREELLSAPLDPNLHRRLMKVDRRYRAMLREKREGALAEPGAAPHQAPTSLASILNDLAAVQPRPSAWSGEAPLGKAESEAWTDLHRQEWEAGLRRALQEQGKVWQEERGHLSLRVLYTALENAERAGRAVREWMHVPGAYDRLLSLHDAEVLQRMMLTVADALVSETAWRRLRAALSQVREEPFPRKENEGVMQALLEAAQGENVSPLARQELLEALRSQYRAPRDPLERAAIRDAAQAVLSLLDALLADAPTTAPGAVPEGSILYSASPRTALASPDGAKDPHRLVIFLPGGTETRWQGMHARWQQIGGHWQLLLDREVALIRPKLPAAERMVVMHPEPHRVEVYLSGSYLMLVLDRRMDEDMNMRAGLAHLIAVMMNPEDAYAALRLSRLTAQVLRHGQGVLEDHDLEGLTPDSADKFLLASGEALLAFCRKGAETLVSRIRARNGENTEADLRAAGAALGVDPEITSRLRHALQLAAFGGITVPPGEWRALPDVPSDGNFASALIGEEPVSFRLEGRAMTLRKDYRGQLMAVLPGYPAQELHDVLVLRMPTMSVLVLKQGAQVSVGTVVDPTPN
ncbi:hypothetical protein [Deinococcus enclensis]|uniref:DUF1631 family protein n=1 Tax=Deinococcus enclensis TaxID=1049582 RepID=A0ABT9M8W8_9DEIO|nr:hypothetical protein [Deinococcus enclensis]MDP9762954.1 hypothetical protein [Deinococcus enclensis]